MQTILAHGISIIAAVSETQHKRMTIHWPRLLRHTLFWIVASTVLVFVIKADQGSLSFSISFTLAQLPVVIATAYAYIYWLFPKYLFQGKMLPFAVFGFFLFVASIWLETLVILWSLVFLGNYRFEGMTPISTNIAQLAVTLYFLVFLITIGHLIRHRVLKKESSKARFLQVRADRQVRQVPLADILYIESLDDYVVIHLPHEQITTRMAISKLVDELPDDFVRVHRSFVVHRKHIKAFTKEKVSIAETDIPISRTYKKAALEQLEG